MRPSYWFLGVLLVFVLIGIALGLGQALLIGQLTHGAAFAFGRGVGAVVVTFGSCALWIVIMYQIPVQIDKRVWRKQRAQKAKAREERPRPRKRRKKQQF
jgi:hypothetical protein